jgi:peptide-methionine (S)-S-oxide reductase
MACIVVSGAFPGFRILPPGMHLYRPAPTNIREVARAASFLRTFSRATGQTTMKGIFHLSLVSVLLWGGPGAAFSSDMNTNKTELATLGGGCFWCLEACFELIPGVKAVTSGYAAGLKDNPTYKEVCSGATGHAEVVQIEFDPAAVSYEKLLETFWQIHDPTSLNRQGGDVGTQYRSIILHHSEAQKAAAEKSQREAQKELARPIVTQLEPLKKFWPAEDYHQDYFRKHPGEAYCQAVVRPKVEKVGKKLKAEKK